MCHYSPAAALTKALAICIEFELFLCPLAATVRKEANERERLEERVREREMSKKKRRREDILRSLGLILREALANL